MKGLSQDLSAGPQWLYMWEDPRAYATHFFGLPKYFEEVRGLSACNVTDDMEKYCVEIIRFEPGRYSVAFRRGPFEDFETLAKAKRYAERLYYEKLLEGEL